MAAIDRVRVLVVGDSGVGKTSLVHLICANAPIGNPSYTIGCSVEVKLHEYKAGTPEEKSYFIELWDIGGSAGHKNSRSIFYHPIHGIILVHDLANRKSQINLRKWLSELLSKDHKIPQDGNDYDPEQFVGNQIPILIIGTKLDLAQIVRDNGRTRASSIADECCSDEVFVDCNQVRHLSAGSSNAVKLSRFFDKVIERKFYSREGSMVSVDKGQHRVQHSKIDVDPTHTKTLITNDIEDLCKFERVLLVVDVVYELVMVKRACNSRVKNI
ncbi:rab-like protein 3 [Tubulanus polymorphus]|uniref:rab-like protein 3 n=1 Tax=Tubulanus polymorphus TaxID=672921 RepID=UPI003DA5FCC3